MASTRGGHGARPPPGRLLVGWLRGGSGDDDRDWDHCDWDWDDCDDCDDGDRTGHGFERRGRVIDDFEPVRHDGVGHERSCRTDIERRTGAAGLSRRDDPSDGR
jgi:hypothetical protein